MFFIKIIYSILTDYRDFISLTSSTCLYDKNPAVKFQTPEAALMDTV